MRQTRMNIAKPDITKLFESYPTKVFERSQIEKILADNKDFWRLAESTTVQKFIEFLLNKTMLKSVKFEFPSRSIIRYTWGKVSTYAIVLSLKANSYLTHYTSMQLHGLTEQIPRIIYLNFEQPPKRYQNANLVQTRIDSAFKRPMRISRNIASYEDKKVCVLNGMHTGELGVIEIQGPEGEVIRVTDIERTLIDIAVRPGYSGGVFEVLEAYRLAKGKVSINKLSAMLKKLNYIYPYHQPIGLYLEKSGVYKESSIQLLRKFDIKYDFYLTHQMGDMNYSKEWRLYFPKNL